jgi:hypothetical protein
MPRALTRARHDARQHFSEVSTRDRIRNKFRKVSLARDPANKNFGYDTPQKNFTFLEVPVSAPRKFCEILETRKSRVNNYPLENALFRKILKGSLFVSFKKLRNFVRSLSHTFISRTKKFVHTSRATRTREHATRTSTT